MATTRITEELLTKVTEWIAENGLIDYGGATVKDFYIAMGIPERTYYDWRKGNAGFAEAIKKGKEIFANSLEKRLVESMANSARGYTWKKTKEEYKVDGGKDKLVKRTVEDCHVPPNTAAAIFLLTNLDPERWKNKVASTLDAKLEAKAEMDATVSKVKQLPKDALCKIADILQEEQTKGNKG